MRAIAFTDDASSVFSDTGCSFATCSSEGTPTLTKRVIANHPRMIGAANLRTGHATNGRPMRSWGACGLLTALTQTVRVGAHVGRLAVSPLVLQREDGASQKLGISPSP